MMRLLAITAVLFTRILYGVSGFQTVLVPSRHAAAVASIRSDNPALSGLILHESKGDSSVASSGGEATTSTLKELIKAEFPAFYSLLSMNDDIWKIIAEKESSTGCAIFAPSEAAFENLGEKKLQQLKDDRNEETAKKMGLYHVVTTEPVTAAKLRTEDWTGPKPTDGSPRPIKVKALVTMGGEVPVGRSKSGGFFLGLGAKEDGDVVIGPDAKMVKSYKVGNSFVHEVDALISPVLLWRYCDQLRIPGF